jgi:hypothetical protein
VEITNIEEIPERLNIRLISEKHDPVGVADFVQDGEAAPNLVTVFKSHAQTRSALFVIVKWYYYLPGVNTEGDFYEVHAYVPPKDDNKPTKLVENKRLTDLFGSDGKKEGALVHCRFKDAQSIRKELSHLSE